MTGTTADAWGRVEASDSHVYLVKTDERGGKAIRASEWVGTRLAEELNMPCPTPKVIRLSDGQLCFGSRIISGIADVARTSQILTSATVGLGATPIPGLQGLLSALYTFDMFINNVDRHDENYLSVEDRGTRRFYAIDFGRSLFWHDRLDGFPAPTQLTRITFKKIVQRHGFDLAAANAMIDRLAGIGSEKISAAFSSMPDSWLEQAARLEFTNWWENGERQRRLDALRKGLSDASLI
ncbi:HipA family kinase [Mesorhizobium sp. BHbsci]